MDWEKTSCTKWPRTWRTKLGASVSGRNEPPRFLVLAAEPQLFLLLLPFD
jgi:hypothetical protein